MKNYERISETEPMTKRKSWNSTNVNSDHTIVILTFKIDDNIIRFKNKKDFYNP